MFSISGRMYDIATLIFSSKFSFLSFSSIICPPFTFKYPLILKIQIRISTMLKTVIKLYFSQISKIFMETRNKKRNEVTEHLCFAKHPLITMDLTWSVCSTRFNVVESIGFFKQIGNQFNFHTRFIVWITITLCSFCTPRVSPTSHGRFALHYRRKHFSF